MSHYKLKGTSGSVINQSFPFGDSIVLGSSADCDVQLDEPDVSARHADIRLHAANSLLLPARAPATGTLLGPDALLGRTAETAGVDRRIDNIGGPQIGDEVYADSAGH